MKNITQIDFSSKHIINTMKNLKKGDKVIINSKKIFIVNEEWNTLKKEYGFKKTTVGIISRGSSCGRLKGKGGFIMDYDDCVVFQSTMKSQVKKVLNLEIN